VAAVAAAELEAAGASLKLNPPVVSEADTPDSEVTGVSEMSSSDAAGTAAAAGALTALRVIGVGEGPAGAGAGVAAPLPTPAPPPPLILPSDAPEFTAFILFQ
jgi:hypothetical protein